MGTNFYLRIIPTKKKKSELCKLIDSNDFDKIKEEVELVYGDFKINYDGSPIGGVVHLGKRSGGWKFLWNPNLYIINNGHFEWYEKSPGVKCSNYVEEPDSYIQLYPLTKEGIWNYINQPNREVYDEYGEKQDKEKFFEEAVNWNTWYGKEAWDSKTYADYERLENKYTNTYQCDSPLIKKLISDGYKMISYSHSDFYSDGLRFATSTNFS